MSRLSVSEAAERLGVSPARVRQRIDDDSLVAEKIGGRWLVDLGDSRPAPARLGRPVSPSSVWWSLASAEVAKAALAGSAADLVALDAKALREAAMPAVDVSVIPAAKRPPLGSAVLEQSLLPRMKLAELVLADLPEVKKLSRSSRNRAVHRLADAVQERDHDGLLAWLSFRACRQQYVAAAADLADVREDNRVVASGVSHPDSNLDDPRIVEGYVSADDVDQVVGDYWLERPVVDERPNVVLHVAPVRPSAVGSMLLAADLSEHGGPREVRRAHELLDAAIDALVPADQQLARG